LPAGDGPSVPAPAHDALPQPIADSSPGRPLVLPGPTNTTGLVPTGYPRTPEGAVAQLAAIDALAFRDLNPAGPRSAYDWAALPGAVALQAWTPQVGVSAILNAAGIPTGSAELTSTWTLTHAQVKGVLRPLSIGQGVPALSEGARDQVARRCFEHARSHGDVSLVLYDVTTLSFEAEKEEDLRKVGFSKERRVDPQGVVGLLIDRGGFPPRDRLLCGQQGRDGHDHPRPQGVSGPPPARGHGRGRRRRDAVSDEPARGRPSPAAVHRRLAGSEGPG
jgi:hypothetical protein